MISNWKSATLGDLCSEKSGIQTGPFGSQLYAHEYTNDGIPVVMPKDISGLRILETSIARIPESRVNDLKKHKLQPGDIVFGRRGEIGRCALVTANEKGWICGTGCLRVRLKKNISPEFVAYFLGLPHTIYWLESNAVGQTMLNLNTKILLALPIMLPSLDEQREIAGILSTWDEAIRLTQALIAGKQQRKKGLMQRLLTGQVRFPGFAERPEFQETRFGLFPANWEMVHLESVATINAKSLSSKTKPDKVFQYIDLSAVNKGEITFPNEIISFAELPSRARRILRNGDVIMATVRPNLLAYAVCDFDPKDILCSTGFVLISPKNKSDTQFIYQSLYGALIQRQLHGLVTGSNYPAVNSSEVANLIFAWPNNAQERHRIAAILQACDREIHLLQQKLAALQQQKKGLMQRLLTGEVRAVPPVPGKGQTAPK